MADVRALLQSERAKRRITHPHATYTSDGKLLCNLCETLVKNEAQWQSHLHSTQHNLRSQRAQDAKESRGVGASGAGTKRKLESIESPRVEPTKKRARDDDEQDGEVEVESTHTKAKAIARPKKMVKFEEPTATASSPPINPVGVEDDSIDESELQALEADLAALDEPSAVSSLSALNSEATISAPAMTAEELAAQDREERGAQKGRRDREIANEREEAERAMEDEFAEMEGLEERVRKLRERREALRLVSPEVETGGTKDEPIDDDSQDHEDSDEDDGDGWGFGGS